MICPPGYYCDQPDLQSGPLATDEPLNTSGATVDESLDNYRCPVGHFCPAGTQGEFDNPCDPGSWNPTEGGKSKDVCIPAPPGFYIPIGGRSSLPLDASILADYLCDAGYYCKVGSSSATPSDPDMGGEC